MAKFKMLFMKSGDKNVGRTSDKNVYDRLVLLHVCEGKKYKPLKIFLAFSSKCAMHTHVAYIKHDYNKNFILSTAGWRSEAMVGRSEAQLSSWSNWTQGRHRCNFFSELSSPCAEP